MPTVWAFRWIATPHVHDICINSEAGVDFPVARMISPLMTTGIART